MEIRQRLIGTVAVLTLTGRLTVSDEPALLKTEVADAIRRGARNVLLDLSDVSYIDSTRIGELIASHITVTRQGGRLKLLGTPPRVLELLAVAALDGVFESFDSLDDALQSFG